MLRESKLFPASTSELAIQLFIQISDEIYGGGRLYVTQSCPFAGQSATLLAALEGLQDQTPIIQEAWLLYLPMCFKHKQCLHCFEEPDEPNPRGMKALRQQVVAAASALITDIHRVSISPDSFISPVMASSRIFIAGCSIATSISKRWTSPHCHTMDLIRCTEILTLFACHWKGGHKYRKVWRMITASLGLETF